MVKVLDAMMNSVVSGWTLDNTSRSWEPSTLETKCMFRRGWPKGLSAVHHQRAKVGAADTDVDDVGNDLIGIAQPAAAADFMRELAHALQDMVDQASHLHRLRRWGHGAVAQGDVEYGAVFRRIDFSPWNICCIRSGTPASRATRTKKSDMVSSLIRFLE